MDKGIDLAVECGRDALQRQLVQPGLQRIDARSREINLCPDAPHAAFEAYIRGQMAIVAENQIRRYRPERHPYRAGQVIRAQGDGQRIGARATGNSYRHRRVQPQIGRDPPGQRQIVRAVQIGCSLCRQGKGRRLQLDLGLARVVV